MGEAVEAYVARIISEVTEGVIEALAGQDARPLLRYRGVAERLGVSERTARMMVERGDLASIIVADGSRRVEQAEVDRYIAARRDAVDPPEDGER